jgi:hypothetical protein
VRCTILLRGNLRAMSRPALDCAMDRQSFRACSIFLSRRETACGIISIFISYAPQMLNIILVRSVASERFQQDHAFWRYDLQFPSLPLDRPAAFPCIKRFGTRSGTVLTLTLNLSHPSPGCVPGMPLDDADVGCHGGAHQAVSIQTNPECLRAFPKPREKALPLAIVAEQAFRPIRLAFLLCHRP